MLKNIIQEIFIFSISSFIVFKTLEYLLIVDHLKSCIDYGIGFLFFSHSYYF